MTDEKILELISGLNVKQRRSFEQYLEYQLVPDVEDVDIQKYKYSIYEKYATVISKLIAKIEVYVHDLPRKIVGILEMIFRILAAASGEKDKNREIKLYKIVYGYEDFLINILRLTLIDIYVKEIKNYKSTLIKFNCDGIENSNGMSFIDEVNKGLKDITPLYKKGKRKFKESYGLNLVETMFFLNNFRVVDKYYNFNIKVNVYEQNELTELTEAFQIAETIIGICEANYSKIINNGYRASVLRRIVNSIPMLISFLLAVGGIVLYCTRMMGER